MLTFTVAFTETKEHDFPVRYPWYGHVDRLTDEYLDRCCDIEAFGVSKGQVKALLTAKLAKRCNVAVKDIALREWVRTPRGRR